FGQLGVDTSPVLVLEHRDPLHPVVAHCPLANIRGGSFTAFLRARGLAGGVAPAGFAVAFLGRSFFTFGSAPAAGASSISPGSWSIPSAWSYSSRIVQRLGTRPAMG